MSSKSITFPASTVCVAPSSARQRRLLQAGQLAGLLAGPTMVVLWLGQGLLRDDYDFGRHPMSLLALGNHGWVQIANFLICGGLVLSCAAGLRSAMLGRGSTWTPRLVTVMGMGLLAAGVFTTDPGAGFPAGAPEGAPEMSWHGILHEVSHVVVVIAWVAACLVLRSRFASQGRRGWARASVAVIPATFLVVAVPHLDSFPVRIALASLVQLLFVGVAATKAQR